MKILVILINRFGDTIQASPLFKSLSLRGYEVHILTTNRFSAICEGISSLERVWDIRSGDQLHKLIPTINKENFDVVVNLSPSKQAAQIASMIRTNERRGLGVSIDGGMAIWGRWANYYLSVAHGKSMNMFNVTDLFAAVAQCRVSTHGQSIHTTPRFESMVQNELNGLDDYILVNPGASRPDRIWPIEKYIGLIRNVIKRTGMHIIITGAPNETDIINDISNGVNNNKCTAWHSRTGNVMELVALTDHCKLVIGNDSAPVQLGARMGKPVLCFSIPPANYWSTGPYGPNAYVIQGRKEDIDVGSAVVMTMEALQKPGVPYIRNRKVEIAKSRMDNGLTFDILNNVELTYDRFLATIMNATSPHFFEGKIRVLPSAVADRLVEQYTIPEDFVFGVNERLTGFTLVADLMNEMLEICIKMENKHPDGANIPIIRALKSRIDSIDKSIKMIEREHPAVKFLTHIYFVTKGGINDHNYYSLIHQYGYWAMKFSQWARIISHYSEKVAKRIEERGK